MKLHLWGSARLCIAAWPLCALLTSLRRTTYLPPPPAPHHHCPLLTYVPPSRSIGETVEEVNDSGFNGNVPTLQTQLLADDSMLQVGGTARVVRTLACMDE